MTNFTSVTAFLNSTVKRFLLLFCIGLIVRMGFNIANGWYLFSSSKEPQKIAHEIVRGNGFSNPFLLPTGPTAHLPLASPAYCRESIKCLERASPAYLSPTL